MGLRENASDTGKSAKVAVGVGQGGYGCRLEWQKSRQVRGTNATEEAGPPVDTARPKPVLQNFLHPLGRLITRQPVWL